MSDDQIKLKFVIIYIIYNYSQSPCKQNICRPYLLSFFVENEFIVSTTPSSHLREKNNLITDNAVIGR